MGEGTTSSWLLGAGLPLRRRLDNDAGMEITPTQIAVILALTLTLTTSQYFYFKDSVFDEKARIANSHNASNYWGEPNAEFDWCERNYYRSAYVSELINTVTGFLYICVAVISYALMSANVMTTHVKLNLLFITMIGIGTVMFHCTLQYEHQLVDELPICKYIMAGLDYSMIHSTNGSLLSIRLPCLQWGLGFIF